MSRALTEEEFKEWKLHPGTVALMQILEAKRETLRRMWEGGSFTDYEKDATTLVNVGNLGTCRGYAFVTEFTYEDYIGELDEEYEWARPARGGGTD